LTPSLAQIYFDDEDLTAAYRVYDGGLTLRFGGAGELRLVRADAPPQ